MGGHCSMVFWTNSISYKSLAKYDILLTSLLIRKCVFTLLSTLSLPSMGPLITWKDLEILLVLLIIARLSEILKTTKLPVPGPSRSTMRGKVFCFRLELLLHWLASIFKKRKERKKKKEFKKEGKKGRKSKPSRHWLFHAHWTLSDCQADRGVI